MRRDTRSRFWGEVRRLEPALRRAFEQAVRDIRDTADYRSLVRAIETGDIEGALSSLRLGPEIYAPMAEALRNAYVSGGTYTLQSVPDRNPKTGTVMRIRFSPENPRAQRWISENSSRLIVEVSKSQRDAVRQVLSTALSEGQSPLAVARNIVGSRNGGTGVIGLTTRESGWVRGYRQKLISEGRPADQVERMTQRYNRKLLVARGQRIARTETIAALNAGRLEGAMQMVDLGEITSDAVTKVWDATGDAKTRPEHMAMDGQTVTLNEPFSSPSGSLLMMPGDSSLGADGADVINCRCYGRISVDFLKGVQ